MNNPSHVKKMSLKKKLAIIISTVLVVACVAAGTVAWLIAEDGLLVNTFVGSDLTLSLAETGADANGNQTYQMVPGDVLFKNPTVTVQAGSEACYVFIKVVKADGVDNYMDYAIDDGWIKYETDDGDFWYQTVGTVGSPVFDDTPLAILKDNRVTIKNTLENADLANITEANGICLTFDACAIQQSNLTVNQAYSQAKSYFENH